MLAGKTVQRKTAVGTFLDTNSASTISKVGLTVEIGLMIATAAGTNSGIIYGFNNFLGTKFLDSTVSAQRIMV